MTRLTSSLNSWNTDAFSSTLKQEITALPGGSLPLTKGTAQGGMVDDSAISVTVLSFTEDNNAIQAKLGIFFTEIVICCGCGDDPVATNAYCEMQLTINKTTAEAEFAVLNAAG